MSGGLLNPPEDLALAKRLVGIAEHHLKGLEDKLLSSALERDHYHQVFGAYSKVKHLHTELLKAYNNEVHK